MLAAVATLLVLGTLYIPLFGSVLSFVWPVPIALAYIRYGGRTALLSLTVVSLLIAILAGPLQSLTLVLSSGLLALLFGYAILHRMAAEQTVLLGGLLSIFSILAAFQLSKWLLNIDIFAEMQRLLQESFELMARQPWASEEYRRLMDEMLLQLPEIIQMTIPAMLLMAGVSISYVSYAMMKWILQRLRVEVPSLPAFRYWQLPRWSVLGVVAGYLLAYAYQVNPIPWYRIVGLNLQFLFQIIFLIQGMSFAYYMLMRWKVRPALAVVILAVMGFNPLLGNFLVGIGLMESLLQYRRILERTSEQQLDARNGNDSIKTEKDHEGEDRL